MIPWRIPVKDPTVTPPLKALVPAQTLLSPNRVVEAVLSVLEIVIGDDPKTVNPAHDVAPEQDTVVVAVVPMSPPVPA